MFIYMRLSFISHRVIQTYAIFIGESRGVSGGEYPQNALNRFETFGRMFKNGWLRWIVRSCVYWFENSIQWVDKTVNKTEEEKNFQTFT